MARASITLLLTLLDDAYYLPEWVECARRLAPSEVVVVDGGSQDGGPEMLERQDLPNVRVVRRPMEDINWKYSAQLNYGAELARGDWILLLDADEVLWPPKRRLLDRAIRRAGREVVSLWFARFHLWPDDRTRLDWGDTLDEQGRLWRRDAGIRWVRVIHSLQDLDGTIINCRHPRAQLLESPVLFHRKLTAPYEVRLARHRRWRERYAEISRKEGHPVPENMPEHYSPTLPLPRDVAKWRKRLMGRRKLKASVP